MKNINDEFHKICMEHKIPSELGTKLLKYTFVTMTSIMRKLEFCIIRLPKLGRFETTNEWLEWYKTNKLKKDGN